MPNAYRSCAVGPPRSGAAAAVLTVPLTLAALLLPRAASGGDRADRGYPSPVLERVERSIDLVRPPVGESGDARRRWLAWQVDYRLRYDGPEPLVVDAGTIAGTVEGWASNSRAEGHGRPRRADHDLGAADDHESTVTLVDADAPAASCREHAVLAVWPEPTSASAETGSLDPSCDTPAEPVRVDPGAILRVRLRLEHVHPLDGASDPLLGRRELNLRVGPASFRDLLELDRPIAPSGPGVALPTIPAERLDRRVYYSAPDSLYLDACVDGGRSFVFPDVPVRRDAPIRLSFRYLRAVGSTGAATAELKQYHDVPESYFALPEARRVAPLEATGEWVLVERVLRTDPEASTVQLRFCLDAESGPSALWIDDVRLEALDAPAADDR